jgi:hypothetical protein
MFTQDAVALSGDAGKTITYLKVDVEGSELKSIREWISSGILNHVRQIGIEIHTSPDFVSQDQVPMMAPEICFSLHGCEVSVFGVKFCLPG